jgi:RNA polymerase sigma-70 factor, ECF subfamily
MYRHMAMHIPAPNEHFTETSDEMILLLAQTDPNVFSVLVRRYQGQFTAKAYTILKSREDAEEVTIDAFAKIYQYAARFSPADGATFKSWGYKILVNTALTRYQSLKRDRGFVAEVENEWYEVMPDTAMRQFEKAEMSEMIVSVLARLPDSMRRVLRMYFIDGLSQQDIAEREGTTVGAVKTRMHRAKQEFKAVFQDIGVW